MKKPMSRREFLGGCVRGAGLVLAASLTPGGCRVMGKGQVPPPRKGTLSPDVWVRVTPENEVWAIVNKSEMGQGVHTALPMILVEEMDAAWEQVRVEVAPAASRYVDPVWKMQITGGSTSVRNMVLPLRKAGATARQMLLRAAADAWGVPVEACQAFEGRVVHRHSGRSLSYGALAERAAALPVPQDPPLKRPGTFRILGRPLPRLDIEEKVQGTAKFGLDTRVSGMLYAVVLQPPSYGSRATSWDTAAAKGVPGVKEVVPVKRGVAVCAETYEAAVSGAEALRVRWGSGEAMDLSTDSLERHFAQEAKRQGVMARDQGDVAEALARAEKRIQASYFLPYLAHATMEPMNCTARVMEDGCDIWVPTQNQTAVLRVARKRTGLAAKRIRVHTTYLGGGFGRRFETDVVEEALELSLKTRRPVQVLWSREKDMQNDFYRPASYSVLEAGLDASGMPIAWSQKVAVPSIFARVMPWWLRKRVDPAAVEGAKDLIYDVPNVQVRYVRVQTPVPVGFWRSVGHSHNAFTVETFVDELASAAGKDPLDYRLALLEKQPRARRVLEIAAEKAGWSVPLGEGEGRGLAQHCSFGTYVAQVAEISLDRGAAIRVHRVVCAVDCGLVVNPDILAAQVEGAVLFGLSAALKEQVEFGTGGVLTSNFDDYEILRMSETPKVEVHVVPSAEPPGGAGEPGVPPLAPAVANAFYAATGRRVRRLPMRPENIGAA